jgi:hypothetical protein
MELLLIQGTIDCYYNDILSCIRRASDEFLPAKCIVNSGENFIIPGWNDYVEDKHQIARELFVNWVQSGRQRQGIEFFAMRKRRVQFKLALQQCRLYANTIHADTCAHSLLDKDFNKFWKDIA